LKDEIEIIKTFIKRPITKKKKNRDKKIKIKVEI
jgi:hypothetical protein